MSWEVPVCKVNMTGPQNPLTCSRHQVALDGWRKYISKHREMLPLAHISTFQGPYISNFLSQRSWCSSRSLWTFSMWILPDTRNDVHTTPKNLHNFRSDFKRFINTPPTLSIFTSTEKEKEIRLIINWDCTQLLSLEKIHGKEQCLEKGNASMKYKSHF